MPLRYFDAHCDTLTACYHSGQHLLCNHAQADLTRAQSLDGYVQTYAMFADPNCFGRDPARLLAHLHELHAFFLAELQHCGGQLRHCRSAAQIQAALQKNRAAALLSIESADLLGCQAKNVALAASWGVRFVNLTWNCANSLSGSNCEDTGRGLSAAGREFVRALEACGILPDVSHLSDPGFWDLMRCVHGPVVATHSCSRAVCPHPRNLTDDQFRAIRDCGGVVGLNFYAEFVGPDGGGPERLIRHIEHFLELNGADTLALGGDLDGCDQLCAGMRGLEDIPSLHAVLVRTFGPALVEQLFFTNWMRLLARIPEATR